jgi:2-methylcitrate dehydratase PrpD
MSTAHGLLGQPGRQRHEGGDHGHEHHRTARGVRRHHNDCGSGRRRRVQARNLLLDSVACAIASDFGNETESYAGFAEAAGGRGDSTVIGSRAGLSPLGATLLNAYQITAATVCDTYVPAHVHITPEIVPPALAIAERDGLDGAALLTAIALGSEVAVRLATGINYAVAGPRGWHMPGIVGPFGAAAAVGHLTGLTPLQMRNAFGLAGSQSAGTWASWGTPTVKFHQSRGAGSGLLAALLAKTGFTSSPDIIGHPDGGILSAYSDGGRPEKVLENIGRHWEFEEIALRDLAGRHAAATDADGCVRPHRRAFARSGRDRPGPDRGLAGRLRCPRPLRPAEGHVRGPAVVPPGGCLRAAGSPVLADLGRTGRAG